MTSHPGAMFGFAVSGGTSDYQPNRSSYSGSIGSKGGARRAADYVGDRMRQGEITLDLPIDRKLHEARRNTSGIEDLRKMGIVTSSEQTWIHENQLLFRSVQYRSISGALMQPDRMDFKKLGVFSDFGGLVIDPAYFKTQSDFDSAYDFAGIAKKTVAFGTPEIDSNYVAAVYGGATTINNDGNTDFVPGDSVCYQLPPIDDAARAHWNRNNFFNGKVPPVARPILVREKPDAMRLLPVDLMEIYLDKYASGPGPARDAYLLSSGDADSLAQTRHSLDDEFFKSEYVHGTAIDAFSAVIRLAQAGLISINIDPSRPIDTKQFETLSLQKLENAAFDPAPLGSIKLVVDSAAVTSTKSRLWKQGQQLAALLGIHHHDAIAPLPQLREILALTRAQGFIEKSKHDSYRASASLLAAAPGNLRNNPGSYEKAIARMQQNRATTGLENFCEVYRYKSRNRIGKAIRAGYKGRTVDVVM